MNCLAGTQALAILVPFVAPFIFEGYKSWLGWVFISILLLLIVIPSITLPVLANSKDSNSETFTTIILVEASLLFLYFIFWIVGIVFAFTRYKCLNCVFIRNS